MILITRISLTVTAISVQYNAEDYYIYSKQNKLFSTIATARLCFL